MHRVPHVKPVAYAVALTALAAVAATASPARATPPPGTVVVAQPSDATSMDPAISRDVPTRNILRHLYDPLFQRLGTSQEKDANGPANFKPVLALRWKRTTPVTWRFWLRHNVKFVDGGPFTAASVVYNMNRLLGKVDGTPPGLAVLNSFSTLTGANAVSNYVVDISTAAPDPLILGRLANFALVSDHVASTTLAAQPDGTGPYSLGTWDRNNQVVLNAKSDYFLGKPKISTVVFRPIPDPAARVAALQAGDVDLITNVTPDQVATVQASKVAGIQIVNSTREGVFCLDSLDNPILAKKAVRQAINYAVDINTIVKQVLHGYATRTATLVPSFFSGFDPKVKPYPYNPARAKQLLASAGYPDGFTMRLMAPTNFGLDVPQAIAGYLANVGIKVNIEPMDFPSFVRATQNGHKLDDSCYASLTNPLFDPGPGLDTLVKSGGNALSWYANATMDGLIISANRTVNQAVRNKILSRIQVMMKDEATHLYLYNLKNLYGVSKRLKWTARPDELIFMYDASLKT